MSQMLFIKNSNFTNYIKEDYKWRDAVKICVKPLVKNKCATSNLSTEIISATDELGAYYILLPNVALLHTRPSTSSLKPALALTIFENQILFGDGDIQNKARIIFSLSSPDKNSHMNIIRKFGELLNNQDFVDSLMKVKSKHILDGLLFNKKGDN